MLNLMYRFFPVFCFQIAKKNGIEKKKRLRRKGEQKQRERKQRKRKTKRINTRARTANGFFSSFDRFSKLDHENLIIESQRAKKRREEGKKTKWEDGNVKQEGQRRTSPASAASRN